VSSGVDAVKAGWLRHGGRDLADRLESRVTGGDPG
jgi:hypothetical protein